MRLNETRIVQNEKDIAACVAWLTVHLSEAPLEVRMSTAKRSRSLQQHRLLWLWNTQIANHLGLLKDEVHEMLKRKFAVPIFTRDDEDYAAMVTAVKDVRRGGKVKEAEAMAKVIARLTSTTDFSMSQCSEYLLDVEHFAAEHGAPLTFPDDLVGSR